MSEKVAIITAAGQGVGAAIARELSASGYRVSLLSNSGGCLEVAQELGGIGMTGSPLCDTIGTKVQHCQAKNQRILLF